MNHFNIQGGQGHVPGLTFSGERNNGGRSIVIGATQVLATAVWTGVRDGVATFGACAGGFLATVLARALCNADPRNHALVSILNVGAVGTTSYIFAEGVARRTRGQGEWIGVAAAVGVTGLMLYAIYCDPDHPESWAKKATSLFGTVCYSLLREVLQNQGRRVCPELGLNPHRALHWERSSNTRRHMMRLATASAIYATSSVLLNGLARQSIISSDFGGMGQDLDLFSRDSWSIFTLRTVNEGLDGFVGIVLLAAFFPRDLESGHGPCSNVRDDLRTALVRGSSRVSSNALVNSISTLIPSTNAAIMTLQALTSFRGAIQGAKPSRPASERGDGENPNQDARAERGVRRQNSSTNLLNEGFVVGGPPTELTPVGNAGGPHDRTSPRFGEPPSLFGSADRERDKKDQ